MTKKFIIVSIGEGWAVAAADTGRELSIAADWTHARETATALNTAAALGPKSLARALKAAE